MWWCCINRLIVLFAGMVWHTSTMPKRSTNLLKAMLLGLSLSTNAAPLPVPNWLWLVRLAWSSDDYLTDWHVMHISLSLLLQAQFRQGNLHKALHSLNQAIAINSSNPIPRFHRAKVLEAIGKPEVSGMYCTSYECHFGIHSRNGALYWYRITA